MFNIISYMSSAEVVQSARNRYRSFSSGGPSTMASTDDSTVLQSIGEDLTQVIVAVTVETFILGTSSDLYCCCSRQLMTNSLAVYSVLVLRASRLLLYVPHSIFNLLFYSDLAPHNQEKG
jgi:hypothetical protein